MREEFFRIEREWFGMMNPVDKKWYKALRYLSRFTPDQVDRKSKEYIDNVPKHVEDFFHAVGYIQFNEKYPQIVTQGGLQQLRDLEEIKRKDLTLIASVVAIVLSFVALAKSMGWI
jgi:hypothetical protein